MSRNLRDFFSEARTAAVKSQEDHVERTDEAEWRWMTMNASLHPKKLTCHPRPKRIQKRGRFKRKGSSSNHDFSGDMLVFGGVLLRTKKSSQFHFTDSTLNYFWNTIWHPWLLPRFHTFSWLMYIQYINMLSISALPPKKKKPLAWSRVHPYDSAVQRPSRLVRRGQGWTAWLEEWRKIIESCPYVMCNVYITGIYIYTYKCVCMYIYIYMVYIYVIYIYIRIYVYNVSVHSANLG